MMMREDIDNTNANGHVNDDKNSKNDGGATAAAALEMVVPTTLSELSLDDDNDDAIFEKHQQQQTIITNIPGVAPSQGPPQAQSLTTPSSELELLGTTGKKAIHDFFYPPRQQQQQQQQQHQHQQSKPRPQKAQPPQQPLSRPTPVISIVKDKPSETGGDVNTATTIPPQNSDTKLLPLSTNEIEVGNISSDDDDDMVMISEKFDDEHDDNDTHNNDNKLRGRRGRRGRPPKLAIPMGSETTTRTTTSTTTASPLHDEPTPRNKNNGDNLSPPPPPTTSSTTFPIRRSNSNASGGGGNNNNSISIPNVQQQQQQEEAQDKAFIEKFWTAYDEILILSLFTQVGILCRLGAASFFRYFDGVFHNDSALFTNLPLNCLSCFVMGMLCSGESLMQIINTRFTPPRLQQDLHREATATRTTTASLTGLEEQQEQLMEVYSSDDDDDNDIMMEMDTEVATPTNGIRGARRRRRRKKRTRSARQRRRRTSSLIQLHGQQREPAVLQELREVQLLAWERRIRASVCLLLFPVKQEDVDVVENYFSEGYRRNSQEVVHHHNHHQGYYGGGEEEKVPESRISWYDQHDQEAQMIHDDDDIGDFDDLILVEEDTADVEKSPQVNPSRSSDSDAIPRPRPEADQTTKPTPTSSPPTRNTDQTTEIVTGPLAGTSSTTVRPPARNISNVSSSSQGHLHARGTPHIRARQYAQVEGGNIVDYGTQDDPDLDQIISNVATGVSKNISRIGRINLADGWDVGTSPHEKSEDLCLGLRDGLCGALSSFSSWISSMIHLFQTGQIGQAFVGLMLGIQLPIIAYRFGQYVSVYIFVWRCRREKRRDERRGGYGIQLHMDEEGSFDDINEAATNRSHHSADSVGDTSAATSPRNTHATRTKGRRTVHEEESEVPSVRAIVTALFIMCLVAQITSLNFFYKPEDRLLAMSLLFSPLGVLARWRMMKFNAWRPSFPIGTFACNVTACALSGTLGTLLAGNPGPRERIALVAIIAGFGGTLSSVARFIVEILSLMDPILFRLDGVYYAIASAFWGLVISFIFSASVDWADSIE